MSANQFSPVNLVQPESRNSQPTNMRNSSKPHQSPASSSSASPRQAYDLSNNTIDHSPILEVIQHGCTTDHDRLRIRMRQLGSNLQAGLATGYVYAARPGQQAHQAR